MVEGLVRVVLCLFFFTGVALIAVSPAMAQEGDREEMLRLSAEGQEHYEAGRLDQAARTYARAYQAFPQAILLKNQMVARYLLEQCAEAVQLGQAFFAAEEPSDEDRQDVEAVFAECSLELAEEALSAGDHVDAKRWLDFGDQYHFDDELRGDAAALRARLEEATGTDDGDTVEAPPSQSIDDPSGLSPKSVAGWSMITLGTGALAANLVWNLRVRQRAIDHNEGRIDYATQEERDRAAEQINRSAMLVPIFYGVGAAVVGTGVFLVVTGGDAGDQQVRWEPQVGPDYTGASVTVRF